VGYRRLGKWDDVTVNQTQLSVVGSYPIAPQFDIFGRIGYNHLDIDNSFDGNRSGGLYGIGVSYTFTPNISARFEVQKPTSDSTNYGVGIVYKF